MSEVAHTFDYAYVCTHISEVGHKQFSMNKDANKHVEGLLTWIWETSNIMSDMVCNQECRGI